MEPKQCEDCRYFVQHDVNVKEDRFFAVDCGHCQCTFIPKNRKPSSKACEDFTPRDEEWPIPKPWQID